MERFSNWEKPSFDIEGYAINRYQTRYGWRCQNFKKLSLGDRVDVGCFTYMNAAHEIEIEDNVQIGSHCSIYSLSTIDNKKGKVHIKKNAVIGTHSTIMPGVTIGEYAIVGAYSFVTKDVPDNHIALGIPAKIKERP